MLCDHICHEGNVAVPVPVLMPSCFIDGGHTWHLTYCCSHVVCGVVCNLMLYDITDLTYTTAALGLLYPVAKILQDVTPLA